MSHVYAEIIKPITCAIADNPKATRTLNVVEGGRLADNCFCFSFDKRDAQPTGLTAPHPEHVWRFDKTGISQASHHCLLRQSNLPSTSSRFIN